MNSYIGIHVVGRGDATASCMYPHEAEAPDRRGADPVADAATRTSRRPASNLADPAFLADLADLNPQLDKTQFADFHSHGWAFRAVFKQGPQGQAARPRRRPDRPTSTPRSWRPAMDWPLKARTFHKKRYPSDRAKAARGRDEAERVPRPGSPVHLHGHPPGKGHALRRLPLRRRTCTATTGSSMEVRAGDRDPVHRLPRHGRASTPRCETTGPAVLHVQPRTARAANLAGPADAVRQAAVRVEDLGGGRTRSSRTRWSRRACAGRWCRPRTRSTRSHPRYNAKSALAKTVRVEATARWCGATLPAGRRRSVRPREREHELHRLPLVVEPECYGCHLPQKANVKMPQLHNDGDVTRNYTPYNFQTLRDDVYMLGPGRRRDRQPHQPGPVVVRHPRRLATTATASRSTSSSRRSPPRASAASPSAPTCRTPSAARGARPSSAPTATSRRRTTTTP